MQQQVTRRFARQTLVLLTLLNFFNYVDRQGVYALFPLIRKEFALSDAQLGMVATACLLVLALIVWPWSHQQVQQLREGLKLDEDSSAVRRELLQAALRSGDLPLAEEQLAALLKREEDDELLLLAAQTRRQQGDAAGAEGFLQRVRPGRGGVTAAQRKAEHDAVQRLKASHR